MGSLFVLISFSMQGMLLMSTGMRSQLRLGSLEMRARTKATQRVVHCRIGSLEKSTRLYRTLSSVHCRIGSLESSRKQPAANDLCHERRLLVHVLRLDVRAVIY